MTILVGLAAMLWMAASFLGYGSFLNALLCRGRLSVAQCAATGVAFYLAVCGVLEATESAGRIVEYVVGSAGVILAGLFLCRLPLRAAIRRLVAEVRGAGRWAVCGGIVLFLCYAGFVLNAASWDFWNMDDLRGYLLLPLRALQEGSANQDPFIYRRIEAGLGGSNYLYVAFLSYADFSAAKLVDLGFGTALLAVLMIENRPKRIPVLLLGLAWALLLIATSPNFNSSPDVIATALTLSLATLLLGDRTDGMDLARRGLVIGLHVFGIVCLKTTYGLAAAAVLLAGYGARVLAGDIKRVIGEGAIAAGVCAVLMIPWMYATYQVAGTPFFPLLGTGDAIATEFSHFADPLTLAKTYLRWAFCIALPLMLAFAVWRSPGPASARRNTLLVVVITAGLMACAIPKITIMALRYLFPTMLLFNMLMFMFFGQAGLAWRRSFYAAMLISVVGVTYSFGMHRLPTLYNGWLAEPVARLIGLKAGPDPVTLQLDTHYARDRDELSAGIAKLQSAVAPGAGTLAFIDAPIFLDYRRNPINTMDWPGVISPAPGLPSSDDPKDWLAYLHARRIRYVLVAREREMGVPPLSHYPPGQLGNSPWQDRLFRQFFRVRNILETMRSVCSTAFEDDKRMAFDCASPEAHD